MVDKPGVHHIELVVGEEWGFAIEKIYLSLNNEKTPKGTGPAETISSSVMPAMQADTNIILPPAWAFGVLYGGYVNQQEAMQRVKEILEHDYPIDAFWIDSYFWDCSGIKRGDGPAGYMNFTGDSLAYPNPKMMWDFFENHKIKAGIWIWNCILENGQEHIFNDFKKNNFFSSIYLNTSSWHNSGANSMCGDIDFDNPASVDYFHSRMKALFDQGLDFVKLDRSSSIPFCKAAFEMTQKLGKETRGRGFIISHTGGLESDEFKRYPTKWSDDSKVVWSQPDYPDFSNYTFGGLKENVEFLSDPTRWQYEIPFLTSDCGGFRMPADNMQKKDLDEELYIRWLQFSAFSPIMETFASLHNPTGNMGYKFSPRADSIYKKYTHLRMELFPYLYSLAHRSRWKGEKMTGGNGISKHQYMLGNNLLVVPQIEKNNKVKIMLPPGTWIDFWTDSIYSGNDTLYYHADIRTMPLFVKAGAIIPRREYAYAIEAGSNKKLIMDVYPAAYSSFTLYEDDGINNDYLKGLLCTTDYISEEKNNELRFTISKTSGEYNGKIMQREYLIKFHLYNHQHNFKKILFNNKSLVAANTEADLYQYPAAYFYNKKNNILMIKIETYTNTNYVISIR
mgnify:CR=1 FL=1